MGTSLVTAEAGEIARLLQQLRLDLVVCAQPISLLLWQQRTTVGVIDGQDDSRFHVVRVHCFQQLLRKMEC